VSIQATENGTNVIVLGKDGFERIRLSTWTSEGSYIHILRDEWQNIPNVSHEIVHISKDGIRLDKK